MKKNCLVAQSGGPTAAINASLAGVINGVIASEKYDRIYGAIHGISGVFEKNFMDLTDLINEHGQQIDLLSTTPAMFLGSCRFKMPSFEEDRSVYEVLFKTLEEMNIGAFFYIGGNDSMDTVDKLSRYAAECGSDILFAGVPKTIDNDLINTDHTPGFGSAAKYIATTMLEIAHDTYIYDLSCVTIVEIMGRNAGWLTAAAALARNTYNPTPQLIYLPEVPFSKEQFLEDIKQQLKVSKNIVVAVSEGIRDKDGVYISAQNATLDKFGHPQLSGVGKTLENYVKEELGIKVRSIELNIIQRCGGHLASRTDLDEAVKLGEFAVRFTEEGNSGFMTALKRKSTIPYMYDIEMAPLAEIANQEKKVPREWINEAGNNVKQEVIDYMRPLIQGEVSISYRDGLPVYIPVPHLNTGMKVE
ncbi:MAG: 6-phosphofructokinase [Eubacterium sp.]|nr:6-phosphofructokinase [Eubacterium sp.]